MSVNIAPQRGDSVEQSLAVGIDQFKPFTPHNDRRAFVDIS